MKIRLDDYLIENGYFDSLKIAQGWIMAGKIVVEGIVISKPGIKIGRDAKLIVRGLKLQYASKGGYKLAAALSAFNINVKARICLDGGASTGGFTDCLLQAGAALIYAVEVGYGQLRGSLAANPRVRNMEKTNIGNLKLQDSEPPVSLAVADLSYLSQVKAIPIIRSLFKSENFEMVFLIKPLYEGLSQDNKANVKAIEPILFDLFKKLQDIGYAVSDVCVSPIVGGRGAIEFIGYINNMRESLDPTALTIKAIKIAHQHPPKTIETFLNLS